MSDKPTGSGPGSEPVGTSPRVRDQPSLTTSTGRSWLILGGLLSAIVVGSLIPLLSGKPAGLALFGLCATVALYATMVIVRVNAHPGRRMLGVLATCMILIAVLGVTCVGIVAATTAHVVFY